MRKYSLEISGFSTASGVAYDLIRDCVWFECEPIGPDRYEFTVLADAAHKLNNIVQINRGDPE